MSGGADNRLDGLRWLLTEVRDIFGIEFGFRLWDGSTAPADHPPGALTVAIADEGAIAALLRRPKPETLANLWAAARLDILNGTIFDIAARRPRIRLKEILRRVDRRELIRVVAAFLLVPRGGPWPLESVGKDRPSDGGVAANKANVAYHYDVSNAFYALWLDPEMVYTCAYFTDWKRSLAEAQVDKLEMCCRRLRLAPGETLLDIGCGWGALCIHAARRFGVKAHGVTLSEQQVALARERIAALGLQDRVTIELRDALTLDGQYDKVVSVGMQEHLGLANHAAYYATAWRCLKPGGLFLNHAITRPGKSATARTGKRRPEFAALTRYIFPGGELDYIGGTIANLERAGFEIHDVEGWREHYARTCRFWHDNMRANWADCVAEVGEAKARVWLIYVAACSIAFECNNVGVYQTLASKRTRGPSGLPPTRADLYRGEWAPRA